MSAAENKEEVKYNHANQDQWGEQCGMDFASAKRQSPIDIPKQSAPQKEFPLLKLKNQRKTTWTLENTGNHAKMTIGSDADVPILSGGPMQGEYKFDHFIFHWGDKAGEGSEHSYDGANFEGEIHYQFSAQGEPAEGDDEIVILCLNMKMKSDGGKTSMMMIQEKLPDVSEHKATAEIPNMDFFRIMNACFQESDYFTYQGSLTHPPCTENVRYVVFEKPGEFSNVMFDSFRAFKSEEGEGIAKNHRDQRFELGDRELVRCKHPRRKKSGEKKSTETPAGEPGASGTAPPPGGEPPAEGEGEQQPEDEDKQEEGEGAEGTAAAPGASGAEEGDEEPPADDDAGDEPKESDAADPDAGDEPKESDAADPDADEKPEGSAADPEAQEGEDGEGAEDEEGTGAAGGTAAEGEGEEDGGDAEGDDGDAADDKDAEEGAEAEEGGEEGDAGDEQEAEGGDEEGEGEGEGDDDEKDSADAEGDEEKEEQDEDGEAEDGGEEDGGEPEKGGDEEEGGEPEEGGDEEENDGSKAEDEEDEEGSGSKKKSGEEEDEDEDSKKEKKSDDK